MLNITDEPEELVQDIGRRVEAFVTMLKYGKRNSSSSSNSSAHLASVSLSSSSSSSLSTAAAVAAVELMAGVVRLFQQCESTAQSTSVQMLLAGYSAVEVASQQVSRLLLLIGRTSDALLRTQFGTLLLMNVTRRVLAILRDSAASNTASEVAIEAEAQALLHELATAANANAAAAAAGEDEGATATSDATPPHHDDAAVAAANAALSASLRSTSPGSPLVVRPAVLPRSGHALQCNAAEACRRPSTSLHMLRSTPRHATTTTTTTTTGTTTTTTTTTVATPASAHARVLSSAGDFASPLLRRTGSIVATEIPGQQMLRRAPSHRNSFATNNNNNNNNSNNNNNGSVFATHATAGAAHARNGCSGCGDGAVEFAVLLQPFYRDALDGVAELKSELESMTDELCRGAERQLHASDTVLTIGYSHTIRHYLLAAASSLLLQHRTPHTLLLTTQQQQQQQQHHHLMPSSSASPRCFNVVVLEGAPVSASMVHHLADALRRAGVSVQVLPDSSAFAVMGLCTKVLVGAESVLSNGGMLAAAGTRVVCVAARHFAIPVLVATTTLKMSPYYPSDALCTRLVRIARSGAQAVPWTTYAAPAAVLPPTSSSTTLWSRECSSGVVTGNSSNNNNSSNNATTTTAGGGGATSTTTMAVVDDAVHALRVCAPVAEYVPPELVTLYATNDSEFTPSQVHRLVRANYSDAD